MNKSPCAAKLALARFKAAIGFVDHVNTATTADYTVVAMTTFK